MNIERKENDGEKTEDLAEMLGGAAGSLLSFNALGPLGAAAAGAGGVLVTKAVISVFREVQGRLLSKREKARIETVKDYAIKKFQEKIDQNAKLRSDDFFEEPSVNHGACEEIPIVERPVAEEIFEGVLLAAQREHEEKKIQFLGNLLVNIAYHQEVDKEQAYLLIKLSGQLSFRQLCLLALFADSSKYGLKDGSYREDVRHQMVLGAQKIALLQEIHELGSQGLLTCGTIFLEIVDITPKKTRLQGNGIILYHLMELWKIDSAYIDRIASLLQ